MCTSVTGLSVDYKLGNVVDAELYTESVVVALLSLKHPHSEVAQEIIYFKKIA